MQQIFFSLLLSPLPEWLLLFPVGIGLALVLGVIVNYNGSEKGNATYLFVGVALVAIAIILNALAYGKRISLPRGGISKGNYYLTRSLVY